VLHARHIEYGKIIRNKRGKFRTACSATAQNNFYGDRKRASSLVIPRMLASSIEDERNQKIHF
jgi:hypothetical protein